MPKTINIDYSHLENDSNMFENSKEINYIETMMFIIFHFWMINKLLWYTVFLKKQGNSRSFLSYFLLILSTDNLS